MLQAVDTFAKEHPDLVIMDITMPNKDGIQALPGDQGDRCGGAKVVMCSAMGPREAMVVQAIQFGALDFIVKPLSRTVFCMTVSKNSGDNRALHGNCQPVTKCSVHDPAHWSSHIDLGTLHISLKGWRPTVLPEPVAAGMSRYWNGLLLARIGVVVVRAGERLFLAQQRIMLS